MITEAQGLAHTTGLYITKLHRAVKRGVKVLDQVEPGWHKKIDLTKLQLSDIRQCMLGQLHGHYEDGLNELTDALTEARVVFSRNKDEHKPRIHPEHYGFESPL